MNTDEFKCKIDQLDSAWKDFCDAGLAVVDYLNPKVTVEIGVHFGYSLNVLSFRNTGEVYGIDIIRQDGISIPENATFILGSSLDEAKKWDTGKKIDLLHIDGDHSREGVKSDYERWLPHLAGRAVVLFHDVICYAAVWNFFIGLPDFKLVLKGEDECGDTGKTFGLGVWTADSEVAEALEKTFKKNNFSLDRS